SRSARLALPLERFDDGFGAGRPYEASDFATVAQEDERRPQLDAERASEPPPRSVLDLQVPHVGGLGQRRPEQRLRTVAVPAPGRAELDERCTRQRVDFFARR